MDWDLSTSRFRSLSGLEFGIMLYAPLVETGPEGVGRLLSLRINGLCTFMIGKRVMLTLLLGRSVMFKKPIGEATLFGWFTGKL